MRLFFSKIDLSKAYLQVKVEEELLNIGILENSGLLYYGEDIMNFYTCIHACLVYINMCVYETDACISSNIYKYMGV